MKPHWSERLVWPFVLLFGLFGVPIVARIWTWLIFTGPLADRAFVTVSIIGLLLSVMVAIVTLAEHITVKDILYG